MKRIILFVASLVLSNLVYAQDNSNYTIKDDAVVVEKVIPFNAPMSDAVLAVRDYFVKQLRDSNQTLKLAGDDVIIVKIVTPILASYNMSMWHTRGELTIEVKFKESRMKANITCAEIHNGNGTTDYSYRPIDAAPLNPKHDVTKVNIFKKAAIQTFENLVDYMNTVVAELEKVVTNMKEEEDW